MPGFRRFIRPAGCDGVLRAWGSLSQPRASGMGGFGDWRKLPGDDRREAFLYWIGCVLYGSGEFRPAVRKSIDEQGLVSRADAVAHRRPYLSPGARLGPAPHWTCFGPGVGITTYPDCRKLSLECRHKTGGGSQMERYFMGVRLQSSRS